MNERCDCLAKVLDLYAEASARVNDGMPVEVNVSTAPPLISQQHTPIKVECSHGTWWITPTPEQIADWAARGVA